MKNNICLQSDNSKIELKTSYNRFSFFKRSWDHIWQIITNQLFANEELQVWEKIDRHGNIYWQAYDPMTGKSFMSGSEADIRAWIESIYR